MKLLDRKVRDKLIELYHKNPNTQVQSFLKIPKQWVSLSETERLQKYIEKNGSVNHRSIQKDEVIIDVDSEKKSFGKIHLAALERLWNLYEYRREQWDSGGDGYHSQFIFKQLNQIADVDVADVKNDIIEFLCGNFMFMYQEKSTRRYIFSRIRKQKQTLEKEELELCSHICMVKKKLIQIEWAPHRKGGTKKPYISDLGHCTTALIEGKTPQIPKEVKILVEERKEKRKRESQLRRWSTEQFQSSKYPACIRFYLGEEIEGKKFTEYRDGTKRAMFHLISYFKHTKTEEELVAFIHEWLIKISLSDEAIDSHGRMLTPYTIRSSIKSNKGFVSCRARTELLEEIGADIICKNCPHKR